MPRLKFLFKPQNELEKRGRKAAPLYGEPEKTCPNCRIAKAALDKAGMKYKVVDAEENMDLCRQYGIVQAPTLVSFTDGVATVVSNASQIRAFAESAV